MSADTISHVWRHSPYTGSVFLVHVAIGDSANDQNKNEIWMSIATLAKKARVERRTAGKAVAQLVEDGWLKVLSKHSGKTTRYRFVYKTDEPVVYESRWVEDDEAGDEHPTRVESTRVPRTRVDSTRVDRPQVEASTRVIDSTDPGSQNPGPGLRERTNPIEPKINPSTTNKHVDERATSAQLELVNEPPAVPAAVRAVFDAWVEATGRRAASTVLSDERQKLIKAALRNYPLEDVCDAVRGIARSAWHMGENDRGHAYNDLKHVLRGSDTIELHRDAFRRPATLRRPANGARPLTAVERALLKDPEALAQLSERERRLSYGDAIPALAHSNGGRQ